jgi:hypothetical protein
VLPSTVMKLLILSSVTALAAGSVVRRQHVHNGGNTGIPGISESDLAAMTNGGPALAQLMGSPEASKSLIGPEVINTNCGSLQLKSWLLLLSFSEPDLTPLERWAP